MEGTISVISKSFTLLGILLSVGTITGCSKKSSPASAPAPRTPFVERKVTRENYMSGKAFCAKYSNIKGVEYGRYIDVPKNYQNPADGYRQIYVYSKREFNPKLETFILIDGGPGQNTHTAPPVLRGEVNELQFDQRGLGCSAPDSFDEYIEASQYSTENTVRDIDEIRKAYGISKISVYGISYGTVPATMYGSKFFNSVKSVVLEGTVGATDLLHAPKYKAEKLNLVLAQLAPAKRQGFANLMNASDNAQHESDATALFSILMSLTYQDNGFAIMAKFLDSVLDSRGNIDRTRFDKIVDRIMESENRYSDAQQPMGVDLNILTIIYCRELNARHKSETLDFDSTRGFFSRPLSSRQKANENAECDNAGVRLADEKPYVLSQNRVSAPIYYFQGSHDGATIAAGAFEHWKSVPAGQSVFLLAKRGGHNPNLERIGKLEEPPNTRGRQQALFLKAILGQSVNDSDISAVNAQQDSTQGWLVYLNGYTPSALDHLGGI